MGRFAINEQPIRRLLIALCLPISMLFAGDAAADGLTPIVVTMLGPRAVRIRIARGSTFPCDSGDNHPLVEGKYGPGDIVRTSTPDRCVCVQQTYQPFSDVDWSASSMVCRPQICTRPGKGQKCVPAPDPTIRLAIHSNRPEGQVHFAGLRSRLMVHVRDLVVHETPPEIPELSAPALQLVGPRGTLWEVELEAMVMRDAT